MVKIANSDESYLLSPILEKTIAIIHAKSARRYFRRIPIHIDGPFLLRFHSAITI